MGRRHEICRMEGERMKVQLSRGQERRRGESGNTDMQDKIASVCSCGLPLKERERERQCLSYLLPDRPPLPLDLEFQLCSCGSLWVSCVNLKQSREGLSTTQQQPLIQI